MLFCILKYFVQRIYIPPMEGVFLFCPICGILERVLRCGVFRNSSEFQELGTDLERQSELFTTLCLMMGAFKLGHTSRAFRG